MVNTVKLDILESTFYRGKAAYMVGRVVVGKKVFPMVLVFLNTEQGTLYVDTALFNTDDLSVVLVSARVTTCGGRAPRSVCAFSKNPDANEA